MGINFNSDNGLLSWKPGFNIASIKNNQVDITLLIKAKDQFTVGNVGGAKKDTFVDESDSKEFTITVINSNRSPKIRELENHLGYVNKTNISFDTLDLNTNEDVDIDGEKIIYQCYFDKLKDGIVSEVNECKNLKALQFDVFNGTFSWDLQFGQEGDYEFKISASDGGKIEKGGKELEAIDFKIFTIKAENINKAPELLI